MFFICLYYVYSHISYVITKKVVNTHAHMMLIIFSSINAINGPIFPLQPHPFLALLWQRFAIGISAVPLQLWPTKACLPATCGAVPGNLATASTRPMFVAGAELLGSMIWEYEEALYKWNMMELYCIFFVGANYWFSKLAWENTKLFMNTTRNVPLSACDPLAISCQAKVLSNGKKWSMACGPQPWMLGRGWVGLADVEVMGIDIIS